MNSKILNIIITGANRGIGKDVVTMCCEKGFSHNIILAVRSLKKGEEVVNDLKFKYPLTKLYVYELDVTNLKSINDFYESYFSSFKTVDILVNNAAVGLQSDIFPKGPPSEEIFYLTFNTNVFGVINFTEKMIGLLSENGKIVMVSSELGLLLHQNESIANILISKHLTSTDIIAIAKNIGEQIKNKELKEWNNSCYINSKAILNSYTRLVLKKMLQFNQMCLCVCPGWCKTDMGTNSAPNSIRSGAEKVFFAIFETGFEKDSIYNGCFLSGNKITEF